MIQTPWLHHLILSYLSCFANCKRAYLCDTGAPCQLFHAYINILYIEADGADWFIHFRTRMKSRQRVQQFIFFALKENYAIKLCRQFPIQKSYHNLSGGIYKHRYYFVWVHNYWIELTISLIPVIIVKLWVIALRIIV
jgi:hypothetical protein